jgi:hypothetical protein
VVVARTGQRQPRSRPSAVINWVIHDLLTTARSSSRPGSVDNER